MKDQKTQQVGFLKAIQVIKEKKKVQKYISKKCLTSRSQKHIWQQQLHASPDACSAPPTFVSRYMHETVKSETNFRMPL